MKFAISSAFYMFTLVWMLSYVCGQQRLVRLVGSATALTLSIELVLIVLQVVRGYTQSFQFQHTPGRDDLFNHGSIYPGDLGMGLLAAMLLLRQKLPDRPFAWSLRLGLLVALVGAGLGSLMTRPTPGQLAELQAGRRASTPGAHSVGVEDGGPGLPFLGWSTQGGDLRLPHFFGLHALQIIPLAGFAVSKYYRQRLNERLRIQLVWALSLGQARDDTRHPVGSPGSHHRLPDGCQTATLVKRLNFLLPQRDRHVKRAPLA